MAHCGQQKIFPGLEGNRWDSFEDLHTFPITRKQVLAPGKDPETAARYDDEYWGMGDDAYIAALDSQHKMHCLNELRKSAFADYGKNNPNKKKMRELDWIHLRHCTDMLVQVLYRTCSRGFNELWEN
jgi:hypothetical protein